MVCAACTDLLTHGAHPRTGGSQTGEENGGSRLRRIEYTHRRSRWQPRDTSTPITSALPCFHVYVVHIFSKIWWDRGRAKEGCSGVCNGAQIKSRLQSQKAHRSRKFISSTGCFFCHDSGSVLWHLRRVVCECVFSPASFSSTTSFSNRY